MDAATASTLGRGFTDPVMDAQRSFRAILAAMTEPGTVHVLHADIEPPPCLTPAAAIALLALADHDTPVWLQSHLAASAVYLRFHTGASLAATPSTARFAVVDGAARPALSSLNIARSFVDPPPILLLDEPTASLDAANRDIVVDLVTEARRSGATVVGIFHDEAVRSRIATRVLDISHFKPATEAATAP